MSITIFSLNIRVLSELTVKGYVSQSSCSRSGLLQGSLLVPTFGLLIIPVIQHSSYSLFVDNLKIYKYAKCTQVAILIQ